MTQPNQYEDKELRAALATLGAKCYQNPMKISEHVDEAMQLITKKLTEARIDENKQLSDKLAFKPDEDVLIITHGHLANRMAELDKLKKGLRDV